MGRPRSDLTDEERREHKRKYAREYQKARRGRGRKPRYTPTGRVVRDQVGGVDPPPEVIAERDAAFAADNRDQTAEFFGDPLPRRSALWLRRPRLVKF